MLSPFKWDDFFFKYYNKLQIVKIRVSANCCKTYIEQKFWNLFKDIAVYIEKGYMIYMCKEDLCFAGIALRYICETFNRPEWWPAEIL